MLSFPIDNVGLLKLAHYIIANQPTCDSSPVSTCTDHEELARIAEDPQLIIRVKHIALADADTIVPTGTVSYIAGWGDINSDFSPQKRLRGVEVPTIDYDLCKKSYDDINYNLRVGPENLCAGFFYKGGKDGMCPIKDGFCNKLLISRGSLDEET